MSRFFRSVGDSDSDSDSSEESLLSSGEEEEKPKAAVPRPAGGMSRFLRTAGSDSDSSDESDEESDDDDDDILGRIFAGGGCGHGCRHQFCIQCVSPTAGDSEGQAQWVDTFRMIDMLPQSRCLR